MTSFLYPFLAADEVDVERLIGDLATSAREKARQSHELRDETFLQVDTALAGAADAMAERFRTGGRLLTFGNGGSSTDAASVAALFGSPPSGPALAARCLVDDSAVLTALGNDVGFELVFARQVIAHGRARDVALGLSTSGNSVNLLAAFGEAKRRGLLTIGLAGYNGGELLARRACDHCLVVRGDSVHRIQETQAALLYRLWNAVQSRVAGSVE